MMSFSLLSTVSFCPLSLPPFVLPSALLSFDSPLFLQQDRGTWAKHLAYLCWNTYYLSDVEILTGDKKIEQHCVLLLITLHCWLSQSQWNERTTVKCCLDLFHLIRKGELVQSWSSSDYHTSLRRERKAFPLSSIYVCILCTGKRVCVCARAAIVCNITEGCIQKISFSTSLCTLICVLA